MAKYTQGILGAFSGKVGPVIGSSRYGIPYMRSRPLKQKDPRTPKQQRQRNKLALTIKLLKRMTTFISMGWKQHAYRRSAFNAATSYTMTNAIIANKIDYASLLVSSGTLTPTTSAQATLWNSTVNVTWTDNSGTGTAQPTDKAIIAIINPAKNEVITATDSIERATAHKTVTIPQHWQGDRIHTYIGFTSQDGNEVANSIYLGAETVNIDSPHQTTPNSRSQIIESQTTTSSLQKSCLRSITDKPPKPKRF